MSSNPPKNKRNRALPHRNRQHVLRPVAQPKGPSSTSPTTPTSAPLITKGANPPLSRPNKPFRFFDLPGEIRNRVYDLVVPEARVVIIGTHPQRELRQMKEREPSKKHKAPRFRLKGDLTGNPTAGALLYTCRRMNREAIQYVYARTTFCFDSFVVLRKFLKVVPAAAAIRIQSLEITHRGYGEPSMLADREWKKRHDAKWAATLDQVKQCTTLRELKLDIVNFDWPIQLELNESWARPLLKLAGEGLDRVDVILDNDSFELPRCMAAGKRLENKMINTAGRKAKAREDMRKAAEEKKRREEAKRKAKKVLTISLPNGASSSSGPAKKVVKSKGLEQYATADMAVGAWCV